MSAGEDSPPFNNGNRSPPTANSGSSWTATSAAVMTDNGTENSLVFNMGGPERKHANNAAKQKAYRDRRSAEKRQQQNTQHAATMAERCLKRTDSEKDLYSRNEESKRIDKATKDRQRRDLYRCDFSWQYDKPGPDKVGPYKYKIHRHKDEIPSWFWEEPEACNVRIDGDYVWIPASLPGDPEPNHTKEIHFSVSTKKKEVYTDAELIRIFKTYCGQTDGSQPLTESEGELAREMWLSQFKPHGGLARADMEVLVHKFFVKKGEERDALTELQKGTAMEVFHSPLFTEEEKDYFRKAWQEEGG